MTNNEITKITKFIHSFKSACQLAKTQQAEIERLKNELHGKVEYIHEQREVIDEKKAEIERLNTIIKDNVLSANKQILLAYNEAITGLLKELDDRRYYSEDMNEMVVLCRDIYSIANDMIGGE